MGAIARRLNDNYKAPKLARSTGSRKSKMAFGPAKSRTNSNMRWISSMYSRANQMLNAEDRANKQAALLPARTAKFEGRLNNAGTIQGALDDLNLQADQLLSGLSLDE